MPRKPAPPVIRYFTAAIYHVCMRAALSAVAAIVISSGCAPPRTFSAGDGAAVRAVLAAQQDAWNRGDLDAFMAGYLHSDALVFTSGGNIRRGWDETAAKYRARYGSDRSTMGRLSFEILDVQPIGADGAVVLGRWQLDDTSEAGGGVFSVVLARGGDGWKVVHDHTSSSPVP